MVGAGVVGGGEAGGADLQVTWYAARPESWPAVISRIAFHPLVELPTAIGSTTWRLRGPPEAKDNDWACPSPVALSIHW